MGRLDKNGKIIILANVIPVCTELVKSLTTRTEWELILCWSSILKVMHCLWLSFDVRLKKAKKHGQYDCDRRNIKCVWCSAEPLTLPDSLPWLWLQNVKVAGCSVDICSRHFSFSRIFYKKRFSRPKIFDQKEIWKRTFSLVDSVCWCSVRVPPEQLPIDI